MEDGSTELNYCQGIVLCGYDSNVRHGSGVDGKSWREFCSLVRRITSRLKAEGESKAPTGKTDVWGTL